MDTEHKLKELLREVALEKAPDTLVSDVLKAIQTQSAPVVYGPLISRKGWVLITIGVLLLCSLTYLPLSFLSDLSLPEMPGFSWTYLQWHIPDVPRFSRTSLIGTLAFALFSLVQIAWLKKLINRSFRI
ncbi:hypothetical protein [Robiginitalea aurantiaca]|uniref:Uncharacterized protein n=1 Tax=Robiginitalea aurantiaca TaxID=3056915 RepID=A0ABT7WGR0_9FLAO|nr:hypothetical protein [Robiginitalea aurantiaca]MDM9632004.1 hypothetical protein [Robiginitalea aurantiaca]